MKTARVICPLLFTLALACGGAHEASVPPAGEIPVPPHVKHRVDIRRGVTHLAPTRPAPPPHQLLGPPAEHMPKLTVSAEIQAVVDAKDRSADDKKLDAGRHPAEMLAFMGVAPGMKVAEIAAGGGYTTELLARAVGPNGKVYGENSKFIIDRFAKAPWAARLAKPVNKNVIRVDREFDDPFPPELHDLDIVLMNLFYHDTVWMGTDRDKMNRAIFAALKPGGVYVVIDHSGRAGTGVTEANTIHRIDEKIVTEEVEKAGFRLGADSAFLRNPQDSRDWNASPRAAAEKRGTSDRFALKFVKP